MKKIFTLVFLFFIVINLSFAAEPDVLDFYNQVNPKILPGCAEGKTGFDGVVNCIKTIAEKLQPIAAVLLVLSITISGAYLIFSPLNEKGIQTAKTILIGAVIGFVLVFSADLIRGLIKEIVGAK